MKRMVVGIAATLAPCFALASGGVFIGGGYYTGNDFMNMGEMQRDATVGAMVTMLQAASLVGSSYAYQAGLDKCLQNVKPKQISAALEAHLKLIPERWDMSLAIPIIVMLDGFCAKRGHQLSRAAVFMK